MKKRANAGRHVIGTFEVESGKLIVSDPCYDRGTWHKGEIKDVRNGTWVAEVVLEDEHEWGMRVKEVTAYLKGHANIEASELLKAAIDVDSGQVGIFCDSAYPEGETGEYEDLKTFYGRACDSTDNPLGAGIVDGHGVCSSSGFGDGSYSVCLKRDWDGKVVEVQIVFIENEGLCEVCGDEIDEDGQDGFCYDCINHERMVNRRNEEE
jgi:hypothetical protein